MGYNPRITAAGVKSLCAGVSAGRWLTRLSLAKLHAGVGPSAAEVGSAVAASPSLGESYMTGGLPRVAVMLLGTNLSLSLTYPSLLAQCLYRCPDLSEELNLSGCRLASPELALMVKGEAIMKFEWRCQRSTSQLRCAIHRRLTMPFRPSHHVLSPSGLVSSSTLRHLDLQENQLDGDAAASLATILTGCKTLAWLRADGESPHGIEAWEVRSASSLHSLYQSPFLALPGNSELATGKVAVGKLAAALPAAKSLALLGLNSTGMTSDAAKVRWRCVPAHVCF